MVQWLKGSMSWESDVMGSSPNWVFGHSRLTLSHVLVECTDFSHIRANFYRKTSLRSLFRDVKEELILAFIKATGLYTHLWPDFILIYYKTFKNCSHHLLLNLYTYVCWCLLNYLLHVCSWLCIYFCCCCSLNIFVVYTSLQYIFLDLFKFFNKVVYYSIYT